jgi:hypothetical protein
MYFLQNAGSSGNLTGMLAHWRKCMSPGTTPVVVMMQNYNYRKASEARDSGGSSTWKT